MTSHNGDWFVQILFGRYTSSELNYLQIIILLAVSGALVYIFLQVLAIKFKKYSMHLKQRIRSEDANLVMLRKENMSRQIYAAIVDDMVTADHVLKQGIQPQHNEGKGDPGWGMPGTQHENVHYATSIAMSYHVIEKAVSARKPGLRHRDYRSIREYIYAVMQNFPGVIQEAAEEYLLMYESAVFGSMKFSRADYIHFEQLLYEIIESITRRRVASNLAGQQYRRSSINTYFDKRIYLETLPV